MPEAEKSKTAAGEIDALVSGAGPLVFISHDSRDDELADAFSKLLRSVTAGMLKSFSSSEKKGKGGLEFGDEWYQRIMRELQAASDVICLFTERSLDRPWLLFEAGVAKGKRDTPVHGIALGVPLSKVSTGPFYQFFNCDDSEEALTKLVLQLAKRIPGLEPDSDVVKAQVRNFKAQADKILEKLSGKSGRGAPHAEENPFAKFLEEMKGMVRELPSKVAERVADSGEPIRRRRMRRLHPMMLEDMLHMIGEPGDPIGLLMAASVVKDDLPWFYEVAVEVYRAIKSGDSAAIENEITRLSRINEFLMHGPFMEEFGMMNKEEHMFFREFPRMFEHVLRRSLEHKKTSHRRKAAKPAGE